jgi:predicted glycogen debranching enzyme
LYDQAGAPASEILGTFLPALAQIAMSYRDGTDLGIGADAQGLIRAGSASLNATWMDAEVDGVPVTPRNGLAVEINALWYSLLAHLVELYERGGDAWNADAWRTHRDKVGGAFRQAFWLPDGPYLADVRRDGPPDLSIRPNMVLAAALERSPLTTEERLDVVRVAEAELLTPRGLRTLAPDDPAYVGRYGGAQRERDLAYHQGTVWPWLLGPYVEAALRARGREPAVVGSLLALLDGFADHLEVAGIGHVSEVFDGDPPHRPGGTIAQAWNVAEMLRAYALLEEVGR